MQADDFVLIKAGETKLIEWLHRLSVRQMVDGKPVMLSPALAPPSAVRGLDSYFFALAELGQHQLKMHYRNENDKTTVDDPKTGKPLEIMAWTGKADMPAVAVEFRRGEAGSHPYGSPGKLIGSHGILLIRTPERMKQWVEALELWERQRPDLIWMDLRMPRMSGFEALQILRGKELEQNLPHTFVVAISASVIDLDRETLRKAGFDDFLGKPFREAQLFEVAGRLLGLRFLTREPEAAPPSSGDLASLKLQPEAWQADLKHAVLIGDTEAALTLVHQLGTHPIAEGLRHLLRNYKLQELLDALNT